MHTGTEAPSEREGVLSGLPGSRDGGPQKQVLNKGLLSGSRRPVKAQIQVKSRRPDKDVLKNPTARRQNKVRTCPNPQVTAGTERNRQKPGA